LNDLLFFVRMKQIYLVEELWAASQRLGHVGCQLVESEVYSINRRVVLQGLIAVEAKQVELIKRMLRSKWTPCVFQDFVTDAVNRCPVRGWWSSDKYSAATRANERPQLCYWTLRDKLRIHVHTIASDSTTSSRQEGRSGIKMRSEGANPKRWIIPAMDVLTSLLVLFGLLPVAGKIAWYCFWRTASD